MGSPLFRRYPLGLQTTYSELKQRAFEATEILLGTPGSVAEKVESGRSYLLRSFYDSEGKKTAEYIGSADDAVAVARAETLRALIADAEVAVREIQFLTRAGYVDVDARTQAILVVLANAGVFRAGALVIGSHSYGAILNDLGVRVASFTTEDIDIARPGRLTIANEFPKLEVLLQQSRVPLSAVPQFDPRDPSTSFMVPRRLEKKRRLRVDLIAPAARAPNGATIVPVPELSAYAVGLPHLRYLLEDAIETVVIGKAAMVPVRVPRPERLAWHKMLVSQLRHAASDKRGKDLGQAAVLVAVLAEDDPEALGRAWAAMPKGSRAKAERAAPALRKLLADSDHELAVELVADVIG